ncbi:MAG: hypothetical protein GSR79_01340 [Desulfurococcales archaeon]|nr:hypothetical protein [Desulfurococcales archaeon]
MARKDFLRNIVNHVLAENSDKLPPSFVDDLRETLGRIEVKYGFSSIDGDPHKLADFILSSDFEDLIILARNQKALWIMKEILEMTKDEYNDLSDVVSAIDTRLSNLEKGLEVNKADLDSLIRLLKNNGYRIEKTDGGVELKLHNANVSIKVEKNMFVYEIMIKGRTSNPDVILKKLNSVRTI